MGLSTFASRLRAEILELEAGLGADGVLFDTASPAVTMGGDIGDPWLRDGTRHRIVRRGLRLRVVTGPRVWLWPIAAALLSDSD
jgi:hypothetical protein